MADVKRMMKDLKARNKKLTKARDIAAPKKQALGKRTRKYVVAENKANRQLQRDRESWS